VTQNNIPSYFYWKYSRPSQEALVSEDVYQ